MRHGFIAFVILGLCSSAPQGVAQERPPPDLPGGKAIGTEPGAKPKYAVTCLVNETQFRVFLRTLWTLPNEVWHDFYLNPGQTLGPFSWTLDDQLHSPDLLLQFDDDPFQAGLQIEQWTLNRYYSMSQECGSGKWYSFVGNSRVQLVER
jgi:hypothetical protein